MTRLVQAFALLVLATAVQAQQPAPAPAAPAASAAAPMPAHACQKPGEHPGRLASDNQQRAWVKNVNGYLECLKKFVDEQQGIAQPLLARAKPHMDAANGTVDEYNKAVAEFKKAQEANK